MEVIPETKTDVSENVSKCIDECQSESCHGYQFIDCVQEECKKKVNKGKIIGKFASI